MNIHLRGCTLEEPLLFQPLGASCDGFRTKGANTRLLINYIIFLGGFQKPTHLIMQKEYLPAAFRSLFIKSHCSTYLLPHLFLCSTLCQALQDLCKV